jgi:outer membrane lipoprotein-sorting protein
MFKKSTLLVFLGVLLVLSSAFIISTNVKKISATMVSRSTRAGKTVTLKADISYQLAGGKMVSHFTQPTNQYIINTSKGEISIYDPIKNTVIQQVNYLFSTETTQFFYFLNNQKADLGLRGMGFINKNTRFEKNLMISTWLAPTRLSKDVKQVELVHNGANPIYSKYIGGNGQVIKKMYYYNYQNVGGIDFPLAITQIDYFSAKDSVIAKTTYADIKTNEGVTNKLLEFTIPANAKVLK